MEMLLIILSIIVFILILKSNISSDDIDKTVPQDPKE